MNSDSTASASIERQAENSIPIPFFARSELRYLLVQVEAIQALGEPTTSFFFNQGVQDPFFSCPSQGSPIPSTDQISNPQYIVKDTNPGHPNSTAVVIPNMEPNQVYTGDSSGTDVVCLTPDGQSYLFYWEGPVGAISRSAHYDAGKHQIVTSGQPTMPTCTLGKHNGKPVTICTK